jgi:Cu/Ag efflux pump CusA
VTYPLVTNMQGLPKVKSVRGASMFGMSFVFMIFEDDADIYWARERVLERLNYAQRLLPAGVTPTLGPDGTGVGHVLWYTLKAPGLDLGEQRALQDWYVKFGLQNVPGVSEVASFGGFQKEYQVTVDPTKMTYYGITLPQVLAAVRSNNNEAGGRKFEQTGTGYIIKTSGYIQDLATLENVPLQTTRSVPIRIKDIGTVQMTGEARLGIMDLNGEGEAVGGIVVIATSFILLNAFGISSNIMSLTGIALAIGVIVDNGIVMTENSYRNLAEYQAAEQAGGPPGADPSPDPATTAPAASAPSPLTRA